MYELNMKEKLTKYYAVFLDVGDNLLQGKPKQGEFIENSGEIPLD